MSKRYYPTTMEALALVLAEEPETPPEVELVYAILTVVGFIAIIFAAL